MKDFKTCSFCGGSGVYYSHDIGGSEEGTCQYCAGEGVILEEFEEENKTNRKEKTKKRVEVLYDLIKMYNEELEDIRYNCDHEDTYEGTYSWRPGAFNHATICEICGDVVKVHDLHPEVEITTTSDSQFLCADPDEEIDEEES